jgi:hypothetical protein
MTTAVDIVVADAQGTPVNHTFKPIGRDAKGIMWFEDQTVGGSNPPSIGYWTLSVQMKRPEAPKPGENSASRFRRVSIGMYEPVLENTTNAVLTGIAPAPTVSYIPKSFSEFTLPERATYLDRANLIKMTGLILQNAQIVSVIVDGILLS